MDNARPKLEINTVAPSCCATRATENPIEVSRVTPATRIRLSCKIPIRFPSMTHAKATVDRYNGPCDVRSFLRGKPSRDPRNLVGGGVPVQRNRLEILGPFFFRQLRGHVRLDEPWCHHVRGDVPAAELAGH